MNKYTLKANALLDAINNEVWDILMQSSFNGRFKGEINYKPCTIEILKDDDSTVWVKWGYYDCALKDLPLIALATMLDNLIEIDQNK